MNFEPHDSFWRGGEHQRAMLYLAFYRELRDRYGADQAVGLLHKALRKRGKTMGEGLRTLAPDDFEGLKHAFAMAPDAGNAYSPDFISCDENGLEYRCMTCPFRQAWQRAGVSGKELEALLAGMAAYDSGAIEAAGFRSEVEPWKPGQSGCCHVKISRLSGDTA